MAESSVYFVPTNRQHEHTLMSCLVAFANDTYNDTFHIELRKELMLHMADLLFESKTPIENVNNLYDLKLRNDCHTHGSIRLWVYWCHKKNSLIPDQAKYFYFREPNWMRRIAIEFITNHLHIGVMEDIWTISHLFGDIFQREIYINKKHVQGAAVLPFNYKFHSRKLIIKETYPGSFMIKCKNSNNKKKPKFKISSEDTILKKLVISKYSLYKCVSKNNTYIKYSQFIPMEIDDRIEMSLIEEQYTRLYLKLHADTNTHKKYSLYLFAELLDGSLYRVKTIEKKVIVLDENHTVCRLYLIDTINYKSAKKILSNAF